MAAILVLVFLLLSSSAHGAPKAIAPAMPRIIAPLSAKIPPVGFAIPPGAFVGAKGPESSAPSPVSAPPPVAAPAPAPEPARIPDIIYVQWTGNVSVDEENGTVTVIKGDSVVFGSAQDLSLYQMANNVTYAKCDFTGAILLKDWKVPASVYRYRKIFNETGDYYYASRAPFNATASGTKKTTGCAQGLKVHVSVIEEPLPPTAAPSGAALGAVRGFTTFLGLAVAIAFSVLV